VAATVEEPQKERTPSLDWAGLLRRAESAGRLRLSAVWRQAKGAGVGDGPRWGALAIGAPGTSHAGSEAGPGPGTTPAGVVLNLAQPLSTRPNSLPLSSSQGRQGWGVPQGVAPSRVLARRAALLAPAAALLGPSTPALTLNMASIPPIRGNGSASMARIFMTPSSIFISWISTTAATGELAATTLHAAAARPAGPAVR
jgi:hypothetical protein